MDQLIFDPEMHKGARILLSIIWERVSVVYVIYAAAGIGLCFCVPILCVIVTEAWNECGVCALCPVAVGLVGMAVAVYQRAYLVYLVVSYPACYFLFLDCIMIPVFLLLLMCFGILTPLNFVESYSLYARGWVCMLLALIIVCLNVLLLDLHTYYHRYDAIDVSMWSFKANLMSLLADYPCTIIVLLSVLVSLVSCVFFFAIMFANVLRNLRPQYNKGFSAWLLILAILCTWFGSNLLVVTTPYLLDARVFVDWELFLGNYFFLPPALILIFLAVSYYCSFQFCWLAPSSMRSSPTPPGMFIFFCILLFFTATFTVLVYGPATSIHGEGNKPYCKNEDCSSSYFLDPSASSEGTLPPEHSAKPYSPPPPRKDYTPSQPTFPPPMDQPPSQSTKKCLLIDRNSRDSIKMSYLGVLHYLDKEGKEKKLGIIKRIAAQWKDLAVIFGSDVKLILSSYSGGVDIAINCCRDVLYEWFEGGGAEGYPLSWNGLIKAIRDIDLNRDAAEIEIALECIVNR